ADIFELAVSIGAPLLCSQLELETSSSWSAALQRIGAATALAKRRNVTLAVRNAPRTFAASVHDMKRLSKEADSAWLRFAPDLDAFDRSDEPESLLAKSVLLWQTSVSIPAAARAFRGFVAVDDPAIAAIFTALRT
ncbi:MAG: hypothetical protein ACREP1_13425, partial [Rhodanobacteraceae bacterium]